MGKLTKKKSAGEVVARAAFSEDMGGIVAKTFGVPAERRQDFQLAYALWPLNRAKECIDMVYYLARNGCVSDDIRPWLERYETLAKEVLPKWARKKSREYLRQTCDALDKGLDPENTLFEFKGFVYGVFCRALMERYHGARTDSGTE